MKKLVLGTGIIFSIIFLLACSQKNKEEKTAETKNVQAEIQQPIPEPIPEDPIERLRKRPDYERVEKMLRDQIDVDIIYYYFTPEGKAKPQIVKDENFEKILSTLKLRYSLTDSQVDAIRNNQVYIGMPRTCVYLAWGKYRDSLGLSPDEVKTVSAGMEKIKITFQVYRGKYKTAFIENDVLVSYQE